MDETLTLTMTTGQVIAVTLSGYAEAMVLAKIAAERGAQLASAEIEARTYHLGTKLTLGRGYDDRLTVRLGLSRSTILRELELHRTGGGKLGGLRFTWSGKYIVSEQACREFLGDTKAQDKH
jgi:hypothetical protein